MPKSIEQLKEEQAKEIKKLEKELEIASLLPLPAEQVYWHKRYTSVKYKAENFKSACAIVDLFTTHIVEAEHWKSGCTSVLPEPINEYAKSERATMDGASYCELSLRSWGDGQYKEQALQFFALIRGFYLKVEVIFTAPFKWLPSVTKRKDNYGKFIEWQVSPLGLGEDQLRRWSADKPDYTLSYYWADVYNWESWKDCELEKLEPKGLENLTADEGRQIARDIVNEAKKLEGAK